jgi:hypothetical protein
MRAFDWGERHHVCYVYFFRESKGGLLNFFRGLKELHIVAPKEAISDRRILDRKDVNSCLRVLKR